MHKHALIHKNNGNPMRNSSSNNNNIKEQSTIDEEKYNGDQKSSERSFDLKPCESLFHGILLDSLYFFFLLCGRRDCKEGENECYDNKQSEYIRMHSNGSHCRGEKEQNLKQLNE